MRFAKTRQLLFAPRKYTAVSFNSQTLKIHKKTSSSLFCRFAWFLFYVMKKVDNDAIDTKTYEKDNAKCETMLAFVDRNLAFVVIRQSQNTGGRRKK